MAEITELEKALKAKHTDYYQLYTRLKEWSSSILSERNDVPEQIRHDVLHSDALLHYADVILRGKLINDALDERELF